MELKVELGSIWTNKQTKENYKVTATAPPYQKSACLPWNYKFEVMATPMGENKTSDDWEGYSLDEFLKQFERKADVGTV